MLAAYEQVKQYIDLDLVRLTPRLNQPEGKVEAAKAFNRELGDPQQAFPSVQVSGTSGKGSTAYFLARILAAAGYRAGLHLSPYLQVMTEKTWISGRLVGVPDLHAACARVRPVAERFRYQADFPASVHGLASIGLSYLEFERQQVEVAVIESSVGGRFDLVQGLRKALCVITDIGFDHTHLLGTTIQQIAWHKAGIMEPETPCVAVRSGGFEVLEAESRRIGCPLVAVEPEGASIDEHDGRMVLALPWLGELDIETRGWPRFQQRNARVAAEAAAQLALRGWRIHLDHVALGLSGPWLPGRMERMPHLFPVVLDGAHNPQKISALWDSLPPIEGRLILLVGLTGERDPTRLLAGIGRAPDLVICTQPVLHGKDAIDAQELARRAADLGLPATAVRDSRQALERALEELSEIDLLLVTGSIYLLGEVRDRWYPRLEVLCQRSFYPQVHPEAPAIDAGVRAGSRQIT